MMAQPIAWPEGKKFAFSVFDDADCDFLTNTRPVYDFLAELGIFTTKSAWLLPHTEKAPLEGLNCEIPEYRDWIKSLQARGFEIGFRRNSFSRTCRSLFSGIINTWLGSISSFSVINSTGIFVYRGSISCNKVATDLR